MTTGEDSVPASCTDCVFVQWVQEAADDQGPVSYGYCRRNPPVPLLKTIAQPPKIAGAPPQIVHQIEASFAPVTSRLWCGEHTTELEYLGDVEHGNA